MGPTAIARDRSRYGGCSGAIVTVNKVNAQIRNAWDRHFLAWRARGRFGQDRHDATVEATACLDCPLSSDTGSWSVSAASFDDGVLINKVAAHLVDVVSRRLDAALRDCTGLSGLK